jgi:M6 family metalloprotease-like protein
MVKMSKRVEVFVQKSCGKGSCGVNAILHPVLAMLAIGFFYVTSVTAAPINGMKTAFTQPDGKVIHLHVYGDEFYARTETEDGYTVVFDSTTRSYYYATLSSDGNELVSTGVRAGSADPQALGLRKSLEINLASKVVKARKNYEAHDAIVQQEARWKAVKEASRKYHEFQKKIKEQEKSGKKGFAIPMGTVFPDSEIPDASFMDSASDPKLESAAEPPIAPGPPNFTLSGDVVGLTILVDFSDCEGTVFSQAEIDDFLNKPGYTNFSNAASVYEYFYIQSCGKLKYNNNVTYYVRVPQPKTYYNNTAVGCGTCGRMVLADALDILLANGYDFSKLTTKAGGYVRACNVFFAGNDSGVWSYGLWPHRSSYGPRDVGGGKYISDYQISAIGSSRQLETGTFIHENCHMLLGYPDLYSYNGNAGGVGYFSVMDSGCFGGSPGGTHNVNVDQYLKAASGWTDIIDLSSNSHQRCTVQVDGNQVYRYRNPDRPQEYFLFEVRDDTGYEGVYGGSTVAVNPTAGLVAYHVLETGSNPYSSIFTSGNPTNNYTTPYEVLIVEAKTNGTVSPWYDRPWPDSADAFKSSGKSTISDMTIPELKFWDATGRNTSSGCVITNISADGPAMTFVIGSGALGGTPSILLSRTTLFAFCDYGTTAPSQSFTICNSQGGTLNYTISTNQSWLSCTPVNGTATNESDIITVNFAASGLPAGAYSATITVTDPAASPTSQAITVSLTVAAPPVLSVSPTNMVVHGLCGTNGAQGSFLINNIGDGTLTYSLTKSQPWLTLSATNGMVVNETDSIYVNLDATALTPGIYTDTVTVVSWGTGAATQTVKVVFSVNDPDIIVTSPNGGEAFQTGTQMPITWTSTMGGNVSIVLLKGGYPDLLITASTTNNGVYSWPIPSTKTGTDFKIRITSLDARPGFTDESNENFSMQRPTTFLNENFEASTSLPAGWTQSGSPTWKVQNGGQNGGSHPSTAHSGTKNVTLFDSSPTDNKVSLYTPQFNWSSYTNLVLSFWHTQERWSADQDFLTVYYSTNGGSSWSAIAGYSNSIAAWTQHTIALPGVSSNSWISFEGNAKYGFGVCLDDVVVTGAYRFASIVVTKSGGSVDVAEGGATDTYTVALASAPAANVNIGITPDAQVSLSTSNLTFTTGNWSTPQTVTVTAVNDVVHEKNHFSTITHSATSSDPSYNGAPVDSVLASITDNDNSAPVVNAGPDQTVLLIGGVWSPVSLSPLAWYDAADTNTIIHSSGLVSQWSDRSGRSNHLSQSTAANRPVTTSGQINGVSVITFDGVNDSLRTATNPFGATISNAFMMAVLNVGTIAMSTAFSLSASTGARWQSHVPWSDGTVYFDCGGASGANRLSYASGWAASQVALMGYYCSVSDNVQEIWEGGTKKASDASGHAVATSGALAFGSDGGTSYDNVKFGEILIIDGTITSTNRQCLEGYLANKWGLTGTLPVNHPYKSQAPSTAFASTNIDGTVTDPDSDPMSTQWTVVSGPGPVVFSDDTAIDTTVNFTVEGVYTLRLTASDGVLQASDNVVITVTTNLTPNSIATPTGLSASALATNQIKLAWTDASTNETGFAVQRSLTSGSGFATIGTASANATNYTDNTVSAATTYYYRVSATNATGSSTFSAEALATTPKLPATVTLGSLSQTYSGTACTATYTTSPTGLTVTVTYNGVAIAPTNAGNYAVTGTVVSATYQGQTNGTLAVAKGIPTVSTWPTATPITVEQAVSNATLTGGSASVPGSFSYNSPTNIPPVGIYTAAVTFVVNDSTNYVNVAGTVNVTVSNLPTYTVSYNGNGNTSGSAPASQVKTNGVNLTLAGQGSLSKAGYNFSCWNTAANGSGTNYAVGGTYTANASVTLYAQWVGMLAPTNLSATALSSTQVKLTWSDTTTNETGFLVERSFVSGSGFASVGSASANATNYTDSTVTAGSNYFYRVSATNATASSSPSVEASVTTPKLPATVTLSSLSQTYNGAARIVAASTSPTGLTVTVTYNGSVVAPTNAGNYAVTGTVVSAIYQGQTNGMLTVASKTVSGLTIGAVGPFTYDGLAKTPTPAVSDGATPLVKDTDYTLSYLSNTNAGPATVNVTGIGNYTGTKGSTFTITPAALTVTPTSSQSKTFGASDPALTYGNSGAVGGQTAGFTGLLARAAGEAVGTYAITQGTLALADNGAFKTNNYTLSFTAGVTFAITGKSVSTLTIAAISPYTYDGGAKTPEPEVRDGGTLLVKNTAYTLSYANNINVGSATLTLTGMGNYSGTTNTTFAITLATPTVNSWPTASSIIGGQALSNSVLSGGSATVSGAFSFVSPTNVPSVGICSASVRFTPTDSLNYMSVTGSVNVTVTDVYAVPFREPFDARQLGDLNGQYGWTAVDTVVQPNRTFNNSDKAAQVSGGGYLKHTFNDARTKVWMDMRVQVAFSPEKPMPDATSAGAVYVDTNGMVMAFNGTNVLETGIIVQTNTWMRLTMFSDYTAKKYVLYVNDVRAGKYTFYNATVPAFEHIKIGGKDTFVDDVGVTPNQPAMKYMPSLILLQ